MWRFGGLAGDLLVGRIRTNLDVLRPSNLTIQAKVNRAKERFVREWSEDPSTDVGGEINDSLGSIGISKMNSVARQRLYMVRPDHVTKVPRHASGCECGMGAVQNGVQEIVSSSARARTLGRYSRSRQYLLDSVDPAY
jgi:hypothetical protein